MVPQTQGVPQTLKSFRRCALLAGGPCLAADWMLEEDLYSYLPSSQPEPVQRPKAPCCLEQTCCLSLQQIKAYSILQCNSWRHLAKCVGYVGRMLLERSRMAGCVAQDFV